MKWNNLKENKCPQCFKDWASDLKETTGGAFGLKLLTHKCGFRIYERKYREILKSVISKSYSKPETHYRPDDEVPDKEY